jgi:3-methyladenine DNA glycosylase AlkD
MTRRELVSSVRSELAASADSKFRKGLMWFFKEPVDPYGVRTPQVRRIAAAAYREVKKWPPAERNAFCRELWASAKMEEGGVAICVYQRFRKQCSACEFHLFEKWIDRYVGNWAHCDGVATWLIAASIGNEPGLIRLLFPWVASKNRWKRRAAAVSFLQEAKQGRNTEAILEVAGALLEDPDDMVQKGVGWVLKEAYPKRPREVLELLRFRKDRTPRLVLRVAAEKMTAAHKAEILSRALQERR